MATEFNREISPLEMERLQTSIKYHDWFLGSVVVVGISLSIYLVRSMNALQEGLFEVRTSVIVMQKDIDIIKTRIDTLDQKMDRYHGEADSN